MLPSRDCIWPVPGPALSHIRAVDYVRVYLCRQVWRVILDPSEVKSWHVGHVGRRAIDQLEAKATDSAPCPAVMSFHPCPHPHMTTAMLLLDDLEARPSHRRARLMLDADRPGLCCRCSPAVAPRQTHAMSWHRMLASCWMSNSAIRQSLDFYGVDREEPSTRKKILHLRSVCMGTNR